MFEIPALGHVHDRPGVGLVITLRQPTSFDVECYVAARTDTDPTERPAPVPPAGFRAERFTRVIGTDRADFHLASEGLESWVAHRGSGVDVFPAEAELVAGSTVGFRSRQLGLWVVAACLVESVIDESNCVGNITGGYMELNRDLADVEDLPPRDADF